MKRWLILEDGTCFEGEGFGSNQNVYGQIVFTTGMMGYQETITDQSYNGQIIAFTYPTVGNYGINRDDYESIIPTCKGIVVKEHARLASNWRNQFSLDEFLKQKKIPGISGIDTRALTKKIRQHGTMKASIVDVEEDFTHAYDQLKASVLPENQVAQVSTVRAYPNPGVGKNVIVLDFGLKHSLLRELSKRNCNVTILPYTTTSQEILMLDPDGVILSSGPGNPEKLPEVVKMIREIQGKIPIFGISLGHQLFALANGASVSQMKVGHRGGSHPVRELSSGNIVFTTQNHQYVVNQASIEQTPLEVTYLEINDDTIEGLKHQKDPAFSVQFHPDAYETTYLFDAFIEMMNGWKEIN